MLEIFSIILALIFISKLIEDRTSIPFVLIIIVLSYVSTYFFDLTILKDNFESIIYMMLPIILIPDILGLSRSELKENGSSIFYLAVVAVIISIMMAVGFTYFFIDIQNFSIYHVLILFTPLMATDVVSVGAIFSKFKLPKKLKLYAEGESLFNDITAMIIFFFIALPSFNGVDTSLIEIAELTLSSIALSVIVGLSIGLTGYLGFKYARDNFGEFIAIYLMASISFLIADKLELSAILAVVISVLFFKYLFDKEGHYKKKNYAAMLMHFNSSQSNSDISIRAYQKESQYLGLFANAVIFITIANVINLDMLLKYKMEILYVFVLTTIIRYIVIVAFTIYKKHPFRWGNILMLSGMKGGLALIMIVSLRETAFHKEMFLAITLGVVILSIFVYTMILMIYLYLEKNNLILDKASEHNINIDDIKELLTKDSTGVYNEIVFEDIVENEVHRAQRYAQQFSLVAFRATPNILKMISKNVLRRSDYFGRIKDEYYTILLTHTSLNETYIFIEKLKKIVSKKEMVIVEYMIGDTQEILYEKLFNEIKSNKKMDIDHTKGLT